jgi:type IV pilus assembly protein PilM
VSPLRPDRDEAAFEDDDLQPEFDPGVVERLAAYTPGSTAWSEDEQLDDVESAVPEPADELELPAADAGEYEELDADTRFTYSFAESRDRAVENGHAADPAALTEAEPDGPGVEALAPGSSELQLPEPDLPEPAVFDAEGAAHDSELDDEAFSTGSWESGPSETELPEPEPPEADPQDTALLEARSDGEPDSLEDEAVEPGLPIAELAEPFDEEEVGEAAEAAVAMPDFGEILAEAEEPEPTGRLSFRRRRTVRPKRQAEKERAPKEKRGSKDKKARRLVGLKIGASQIAAAQVVNNGAPELVDVFREPLEPGLVVSGEVRDPEALGASLKRLFELHKLPKRGVRLGLSNNRIGVRIFEIEGVTDAQQLDNAIRFRAEEVLPIPLDEAVLDYVVLEDAEREDGTPWKRILLVVAYREVVDRYLQACRSAGLEIVGIDLEAFALLRAVEAPMDRAHGAGALVAVAIGHDRTTIAVSTGRFCEFARVLDWGGWSLNVAIARELDRAPSEVEAVKRQLSFAAQSDVDGLTPEQAAKAREAIQRSLAAFVRELVASLQFYQAQPGALGIGEVVLTGGTAHMDGLPEALGALVGVPIRLGDPFKRVKVGPKVAYEGPRGSLSVAVGLGIED